jgi:tetratricopeptide (TPR) repeat protein
MTGGSASESFWTNFDGFVNSSIFEIFFGGIMAQKLTRKQLLKEPDEFITFSGKLIQWLTTYKQQAAVAAGVVVALLVATAGYQTYSRHAETKASELLAESLDQYQTAMKANDPVIAYQAVEKSFTRILDDYSARRMGKTAALEFANICYRAGEFDKAISLYKTALEGFSNTPFYKNLILSSLGYSFDGKKDYESAVKYFEMLTTSADASLKDLSLYNLASVYEQMGNKEKSKATFARITTEFPNSLYIEIAKEKILG